MQEVEGYLPGQILRIRTKFHLYVANALPERMHQMTITCYIIEKAKQSQK
jgi:hypothetical protein